MASLGDRARRRSSLFFGANFSLASLKSSNTSISPSEQTSYHNLKHEVRDISASKRQHVTKLSEPLFVESYLSSSEDDSSSADQQEPESPTFSDYSSNDGVTCSEDYEDLEESADALEDFGLGLAIETYKPSDVARKVSIVVCKPRVVDITPPMSPSFSRTTSSSVHPQSRPTSANFRGWYGFYDHQSTEFSGSNSERSHRSSSSSFSNVSKFTDATSVSMSSVEPPTPTSATAAPALPQRANAIKRNSNRLSTSFSRSFLAKVGDESPQSPQVPTRTSAPRPTTPMPFIARATHDRLPSLQIPPNFPSVDTMPPPPEVPRPRTSALRKKKSIADVWFKRRSVSTYI